MMFDCTRTVLAAVMAIYAMRVFARLADVYVGAPADVGQWAYWVVVGIIAAACAVAVLVWYAMADLAALLTRDKSLPPVD